MTYRSLSQSISIKFAKNMKFAMISVWNLPIYVLSQLQISFS